MKVLHVIPSVGPARGGPSEAVIAMVMALNQSGITAHIATTNDDGIDTLSEEVGQWLNYKGVQTFFHARLSTPVGALREFQYSHGFSSWLESVLEDYDVVHVHAIFSYLSTRTMMLCRKHGKPFIVRPLGTLDPWSLRQKAVKKWLYFKFIEQTNLGAAAAVHCTSETEAANVRAVLPRMRVEVIPHGVPEQPDIPDAPSRLRERWSLSVGMPIILFLSRWAVKKNIPLLLEALSLLKNQSWVLLLAGKADNNYDTTVREAIVRFGLEDRVICPGHVQGEEKNLMIQGADLFVLPSVTENFGIAVAEALCAGLPCVVSDGVDIAPVIMEIEGGQVCRASVPDLAKTIHAALRMPVDRSSLQAAARQRFSWSRAAMQLGHLYDDVFHNPTP